MRDDLRCPFCKSSQTKARIRAGDRICYTCGRAYKIEESNEAAE